LNFDLVSVLVQVEKMHMDRWTAAHNIIHGAAFCLDPEYHSWKHEENPEAYSDFIKMCDEVHGAGLPGEAGVRGVRASALAQAQFSMYKNGEGGFANKRVLESAKYMRAGAWWKQNGKHVKELQKVAVRALSAPVAAGAGERNWSTFGFIVSQKRNRLSSQRAEKLVFVHYNLRALNQVKRVDYEAEYFEWDATDDEGSESETLIDDSDEE
jgi:hypothetical protein